MKENTKKIPEKNTFLGFLKHYYNLENSTMYQYLGWSRQRYHQFVDNGYAYPLTPASIKELAKMFKVPLESMQRCVTKYLIK